MHAFNRLDPPDLQLPPGLNEWGALQAAVEEQAGGLEGAQAHMAWRHWALTKVNAQAVVDVFWFVAVALLEDGSAKGEELKVGRGRSRIVSAKCGCSL